MFTPHPPPSRAPRRPTTFGLVIAAALFAIGAAACDTARGFDCQGDSDCFATERCVSSVCEPRGDQPDAGPNTDPDAADPDPGRPSLPAEPRRLDELTEQQWGEACRAWQEDSQAAALSPEDQCTFDAAVAARREETTEEARTSACETRRAACLDEVVGTGCLVLHLVTLQAESVDFGSGDAPFTPWCDATEADAASCHGALVATLEAVAEPFRGRSCADLVTDETIEDAADAMSLPRIVESYMTLATCGPFRVGCAP